MRATKQRYTTDDLEETNPFGKLDLPAETIVAQYRAGKTLQQIATEFNCSTGPIGRILRESGVEMRRYLVRNHPEDVARGEANGNAKLTEEDVLAMRVSFAAGTATSKQLMARFHISLPSLSEILKGKRWKHVGGPIVASLKKPSSAIVAATDEDEDEAQAMKK